MALLFFEGFDDSPSSSPSIYYNGTNFDNGKCILSYGYTAGSRVTGKLSGFGFGGSTILIAELPEKRSTIYVSCDFFPNVGNSGTMHIFIFPNTGFKVSLFNNTGLAIVNNSNSIVVSKQCLLNPADYNWLSIRYTVSETSGIIEIRDAFGGVLLSYSGNTRGSSSVDQAIDKIEFNLNDAGIQVDNVYILDTEGPAPFNGHLPEVRTFHLLPNGAGDITEWSAFGADTVFDAVKEPTGNEDVNYARSNTNGQRFLVNVDNLQHNQTNYFAVVVKNRLKRDDAGIWRVAAMIRTGGENYESDQTPITNANNYLNVLHPFVNNPNTGTAWTAEQINAIQIGAKAYLG